MDLICREGLTGAGVAARLGVTVHTVKGHRDAARRKLGAATTPRACFLLGAAATLTSVVLGVGARESDQERLRPSQHIRAAKY